MRSGALALTAAVTAALLWVVAGAAPAAAAAGERASAFASADVAVDWTAPVAVVALRGDEEARAEGDDPVPMQVWTVLAAGGAAGVGLVLFVLRLAMGWVKPPPPPEESRH